MCVSACQVEFVRLCVGGTAGERERTDGRRRRAASLCFAFLCVSFIKRRAAVMEEGRKRGDPRGCASRGEMKKREERSRRSIEEEDRGGTVSLLKPERPSMVSSSLSRLLASPSLTFLSHPSRYLTFSLSVCLFPLPWGL